MVRLAREVRDARDSAVILPQRLVELDANPYPLRAELRRADEADLAPPAVLKLDELSYRDVRHRGAQRCRVATGFTSGTDASFCLRRSV